MATLWASRIRLSMSTLLVGLPLLESILQFTFHCYSPSPPCLPSLVTSALNFHHYSGYYCEKHTLGMGTSISVTCIPPFLHRVVISTCSIRSHGQTYSVVSPATRSDLCSKPCPEGKPTSILCMTIYYAQHPQRSPTKLLC